MNDDTPTPAETTDAQPDAPAESAGTQQPDARQSEESSQPAHPDLSAHASPQKTNVLAIIALISGFLLPLAAFICGGIALAQIRRTGDRGRGLAWSGIIVGAAMTVLAAVVSILVVVATAAAVQTAVDSASRGGSLSASQTPGCEDVAEIVSDITQQMAEIGQGTVQQRAEAIAEMEEIAGEGHALASTIDDPEVADAAENAMAALDDVIAFIAAAPTDAPAADPGRADEALAAAKDELTELSTTLRELGTVCR